MNQVDVAALALVLAFGYKGWHSGLIAVVLGLTGGLIAFGLAAVLAPLLAPVVTPAAHDLARLPVFLIRPALLVALTVSLRFLLGFAIRQLGGVLSLLVRGVPPLAFADRVLGIVPMAVVGALLSLALVLVTLNLPAALGTRDLAGESWIARNVLQDPGSAYARLRERTDRLLTDPPRVNGLVLASGALGLGVATAASWPLRETARAAAFHEAPTVRLRRAPAGEIELSGPLAWLRIALGVGVALALAGGLFFLIGLSAR